MNDMIWLTPPSPLELKTIRRKANLSLHGASKLMKINIRTWRRWEKGEKPIPILFLSQFRKEIIDYSNDIRCRDNHTIPTRILESE